MGKYSYNLVPFLDGDRVELLSKVIWVIDGTVKIWTWDVWQSERL